MNMNINIGTDLVYIPKFKNLDRAALEKIFNIDELEDSRIEHLAGIFAAKEAFFKALGKKINWLDVLITKNVDGQPKLVYQPLTNNSLVSVSISHDGDYALAAVVIIKDN
ncbi:MAG: holo-ACP synthase [Candidatus Kerfeldbacteria bacterium]|nr:holo-ACP synthase [Candidatus Kerfeldbacteria bacterium]